MTNKIARGGRQFQAGEFGNPAGGGLQERSLPMQNRQATPGGKQVNDDEDSGGIITAVLGCGLLSPILDRVDERQALPRKLSDCEFNPLV